MPLTPSNPSPRRLSRRLFTVIAAGLLLAPSPRTALGLPSHTREATETWIVLSSDAVPYRTCESALGKELAPTGTTIRSVLLAQLDDAMLKQLSTKRSGAIVAIGSEAAARLQSGLDPKAPFTYCMVANPRASGLAADRPTQGVSTDIPASEQFATIKRALPSLRKIGVIYKASSPRSAELLAELRASTGSVSIEAIDIDTVGSPSDAIRRIVQSKPDIIWTAADSSVYNAGTIKALLKESLAASIPVFGFSSQCVRAGALLGLTVKPEDQAAQAAQIARRFIDSPGEPQTSSIVSPKFRLAVNTVVANRLDIRMPSELLGSADETFGD